MRVLVVTNIYPHDSDKFSGTYVADQVASLGTLVSMNVVAKSSGSRWAVPSFLVRSAWHLIFDEYALIHAHYGFHSAFVPSILGKAPLVVTFHGSDALIEPRRNRVYRFLQSWIVKRANHLIAVSEQIADVLQKSFDVPAGKITLLPCGVNIERFVPRDKNQIRKKLGVDPDGKIVLYIGRFTAAKGVDVIKSCASQLNDITFLFIGQGPIQWSTLNCQFMGAMDHDQIPEWINVADALLLPSQSEGTPVVVLEALASGVPVICTPVGSCPQLIEEGKTGFLVPVGDSEGLTNAIRRRFSWTHFAPEIGRTLVLKEYSLDIVASRLLDLYTRAVKVSPVTH